MNRYLRLLLLVAAVVVAMKIDSSAEDSLEGADAFDGIKAQMISSVEENKRLVEENKALKAQLVDLQLQIEQYGEIGGGGSGYVEAREPTGAEQKDASGHGRLEDSGQPMTLDEVQRLMELQLYDLQYQKQELELDLKSLEFLEQKVGGRRQAELDALKKDIEANTTKTKELSAEIAEQEKAALGYPRQVELLKAENKALQKKIGRLKRAIR